MSFAQRIPSEFGLTCHRVGVPPSKFAFVVNIARQTSFLFERRSGARAEPHFPDYAVFQKYSCSTSRFGIGEVSGSNMTPRGLHRIAEKHGGGWPAGAVFKERVFQGYTWDGLADAAITHRIMWLEGLEPGFNRGGNVDSYKRFIYIHGTGNEQTIGRPASHGCVHLAADDLIPLYDKLPVGTLVWISER